MNIFPIKITGSNEIPPGNYRMIHEAEFNRLMSRATDSGDLREPIVGAAIHFVRVMKGKLTDELSDDQAKKAAYGRLCDLVLGGEES